MVNLLYSVMALTCAVMLLISLPQFRKMQDKNDPRDRSFIILIQWVTFFCIHDSIWGLLASEYVMCDFALFFSSTFFHAAAAITAFLWLNYTLSFLGKWVKKPSLLKIPAITLVFIQLVLLLLNIEYKFMFYINDLGQYESTPFRHILFYSQYIIYFIIGFLCIVKMTSEDSKGRHKFKMMLLCVLAPIICGFFQMAFPEAPFYSIGYSLGCCVIFSHIIIRMTKESTYIQNNAILAALSADFDMVCYADPERNEVKIQSLSQRFEKTFNEQADKKLSSEKQIDFFLQSIIYPEDYPMFLQEVSHTKTKNILAVEPSHVVKFRIKIDSAPEFYELKIVRDNANRQPGYVIGLRNINREMVIKEEAQKLKSDLEMTTQMANRDPLTGVNSRTAFNQKSNEIARTISLGEKVSFAIVECDLNNLKIINDHFGHEAGDAYIKANCNVFCDIFKHSPVYRIGGDEFAIILQGSDYHDRDNLIDKLYMKIEFSTHIDANQISFAAGMAEYNPQIDESVKDVLKRADTFMYISKKQMKGAR